MDFIWFSMSSLILFWYKFKKLLKVSVIQGLFQKAQINHLFFHSLKPLIFIFFCGEQIAIWLNSTIFRHLIWINAIEIVRTSQTLLCTLSWLGGFFIWNPIRLISRDKQASKSVWISYPQQTICSRNYWNSCGYSHLCRSVAKSGFVRTYVQSDFISV